jgi:hypothetical protein
VSKRSAQAVRSALAGVAVLVSMLAAGPRAATARPLVAPPAHWAEEIVLAQAVERGPVTLQEAVVMAMRRFGGRVIRAETKVRGGVRVHEIRLLDESTGRVRTVHIDAETGQIR